MQNAKLSGTMVWSGTWALNPEDVASILLRNIGTNLTYYTN
jgi:hypothetical protein